MNDLDFFFSDLYPGISHLETGDLTTADPDEQERLHEEHTAAQESSNTNARSKNIIIGAVLIVAIIIFFGGN